MIRKVVYFSGNVQGVGFRYKTANLAQNYAITGTVENLPDGRVKAVVEGSVFEVQGFLFQLRQDMIDFVDSDQCLDEIYTGDFVDFQIKR